MLLNASFFRFLAGFLSILFVSFVMLVGLSYYEEIAEEKAEKAVGSVPTLNL